jgi:hypothetical protein
VDSEGNAEIHIENKWWINLSTAAFEPGVMHGYPGSSRISAITFYHRTSTNNPLLPKLTVADVAACEDGKYSPIVKDRADVGGVEGYGMDRCEVKTDLDIRRHVTHQDAKNKHSYPRTRSFKCEFVQPDAITAVSSCCKLR